MTPRHSRPHVFGRLAAVLVGALVASAATVAAADNRVFIPTGSDNAVLIVDPARDTVVGRIDGLPAVHGLAATPDGRHLIAGSYDERPAGTALPDRPAGVSQSDHEAHHGGAPKPPGTEAAVSTVSVIDVESRRVVRRIDVPGAVHHVAAGPQGRFALVTHPNGGGVTVIDLARFEVVATVPTGDLPNYATFSPSGDVAFVSNAGDDTVSVIDTGDWRVVRQIAVGDSPEHLVLSPDGERLFVNNVEAGSVSVVATASGRVARTVEFGGRLHGIDLAPDGEVLFVALTQSDEVVAVSTADGGREASRGLVAPYHVAFVRGQDKLYVSSAVEPVVWALDPVTLEVVSEIPVEDIGHQIAETGT